MQDDRLTIRLASDLKAKLAARADFESRSITEIVVKALTVAANRWATAKKEA